MGKISPIPKDMLSSVTRRNMAEPSQQTTEITYPPVQWALQETIKKGGGFSHSP